MRGNLSSTFAFGVLFITLGVGAERASGTCEEVKLTAAELANQSEVAVGAFGLAVAGSGDALIVGSSYEDVGAVYAGAAYVFRFDGTDWIEEARLVASDAEEGDHFGWAVAIDGDYAVVGTREGWGTRNGKAYVFARDGSNWVEQQKLTAWDGGSPFSWFGESVTILGDYVAVGARGDQSPGKVYIFRRDGVAWVPDQLVVPDDPTNNNRFGAAVVLHGNELAVLAATPSDSSAVYLFARGSGIWSQTAKLPANQIVSMAFDGNRIAAGSPRHMNEKVFVFERDGAVWSGPTVLPFPPLSGGFGSAVALLSNRLLVGAPLTYLRNLDECGSVCPSAGAVYHFAHMNGQWSEPVLITPSDYGCGGQFGRTIATAGDRAFIRRYVLSLTPESDCNGNGINDACELLGNDCNGNGILDECDIASGLSEDCNGNGVPDECDLASGASRDCNGNGIPDECDIASSSSNDCNSNGVPDECEPDCNNNGVPDECESYFACLMPTTCELERFTSYEYSSYFGYSISIGGGFSFVAHPVIECASNCGTSKAHAYRRDGAEWLYDGQVIPSIHTNNYARTVAVHGEIGFVSHDPIGTHVFQRTESGWEEETILPFEVVAFDGSKVVGRDGNNAVVYRRDNGAWEEETVLVPPSASPQVSDIAIEGDTLVIGTRDDYSESTGEHDGSVHVYRFEENEWTYVAKLVPFDIPDCVPGRRFGSYVDLSGDTIAVGEQRETNSDAASAFVFQRVDGLWVPDVRLKIATRTQTRVALDQDTLIVGKHYHGGLHFRRIDGDWRGPAQLFLTEGVDYYAMRTAIDDGVALVSGSRSREVRFFGVDGDCNLNGLADLCDLKNTGAPVACVETVCIGGSNPGVLCVEDSHCLGGSCGGVTSRYLGIPTEALTIQGNGGEQSIKVQIVDMPQYPEREGEVWWAGPVISVPNAPHPSLAGAFLECTPTPHAQEWASEPLHLLGASIIPDSTYEVRICNDTGTVCSDPLLVGTGIWGDVVAPFGASQPNFGDVSAILDGFRGLVSAPSVPRIDLVGSGAPGEPNVPNMLVNFADVSAGLDAFRGLPYAYTVPACP